MKVKIAAIVLMFLLMALLPFAAAKCSENTSYIKQTISSEDTPIKQDNSHTDDYEKILCALTAAKYNEAYCKETIKALAIILSTNYNVDKSSFSNSDFLFKEDADKKVLEAYPTIEECVNSIKEKTLCKNNKAFYIPFSEISNGVTYKSDKYSYLKAVASPWDCYNNRYDENTKCIGVSLGGINYLCSHGENAEEALLWYLPDFSIK